MRSTTAFLTSRSLFLPILAVEYQSSRNSSNFNSFETHGPLLLQTNWRLQSFAFHDQRVWDLMNMKIFVDTGLKPWNAYDCYSFFVFKIIVHTHFYSLTTTECDFLFSMTG